MDLNVDIDISKAVQVASAVLKKIPYATNTALTAVGKEIVDREREDLKTRFQVRKQFILNRVRILQYSRANNLTMIVGIDSNVQGGKLLLPAFEEGGTKTPTSGPELAVPITGAAARPSFSQNIPRSLLYKVLQIERKTTSSGAIRYKGKKRTFAIEGVGVLQRTGPKRTDIKLLYKFERSSPLRQRMRFRQIAIDVFGNRFKALWNQAFISELGPR
jgi:hypothetical protein